MDQENKKPGTADLTFGGAETSPNKDDELPTPTAVQGDEGGGDPNAGAHQDSRHGDDAL
ncbi:hypothetical protein [Georgenia sp. AZ-5]|uniref:hypothetical protein n=1 Tax=Georgenia sp. AZ-5 TaxID=3367526 RepID=UPI003754FB8C